MYSLTSTSLIFTRHCPWTKVTSISKYTYSRLRGTSAVDYFTCNKTNQNELFKRSYVSDEREKKKDFKLPGLNFEDILNQSKQLFKEVQLSELRNAPEPAFWSGMGALVPLALPPLSFIIFGYSPSLAGAQLAFGATISSFLGGVRWGYGLSGDCDLTWRKIGWTVGPPCAAWLSLLLPQTLGFILVSGSILSSSFVDLTTLQYPQWFRAMRMGITIAAVSCLLLTALMGLFH